VNRRADEVFAEDGEACVANSSSADFNSHMVSSPVYDGFLAIGQLEDPAPGFQRREFMRRGGEDKDRMDASVQRSAE
jgi:hypothetical protein